VLQGLVWSGSSLSFNDADNWNTNTNVSSQQLQKILSSTGPATWQKITNDKEGFSNESEKDLLKAKE
jgi:hypothetical protein